MTGLQSPVVKTITISSGRSATIKGDTSKTFKNLVIEISGGANLTIENLNIDNSDSINMPMSDSDVRNPIRATDGNSLNKLILKGINKITGYSAMMGIGMEYTSPAVNISVNDY